MSSPSAAKDFCTWEFAVAANWKEMEKKKAYSPVQIILNMPASLFVKFRTSSNFKDRQKILPKIIF